jgi:putative transposase
VDPALIASRDSGVNNLAAITSNPPGLVPLLVNGRPLTAVNQCSTKQRAQYQAVLPQEQYTSHRLDGLADQRKRPVDT